MDARRTLLLLHPYGRRNELTLTATTTASPENVIIDRMSPVGGDITIYWGDGDSTVQAVGDTASETHSYATAGTYQIRITPALRIQQVDLHRGNISGVQSAQLASSPITYFLCYSIGNATPNVIDSSHMVTWTAERWWLYNLPAGTYSIDSSHMSSWTPVLWYLYTMPAGTYTIDSQHMSSWTPTYWRLSVMPTGTYNIDSQHMATWTPLYWRLFSMPAADTVWTLDGAHFAGYTICTDFQIHDNVLSQAQVDEVLYGLYQASVAPRTAVGGTINVGGTNAAPTGVFQAAAACPVTDATDGKEVCHELLNDTCGAFANHWATVDFTV